MADTIIRRGTVLPEGFVQSLVDYAESLDSVAALKTWQTELYNKIRNGDGKTLINSAPGGKSFQFQVNMTVEDLFVAVTEAIKQASVTGSPSTTVTTTYADFSQLER